MSVSIISACKNRKKPLTISISSWIQFDEVDEIIVTDWDSSEPIDNLIQLSKKIKIIKVKNEPYFNQPQPLNLAASLTTGDYLLKLDNDHILNPYFNFFDLYSIEESDFVVGSSNKVDQRGMDTYFLYPLWGLLYVKNDIFKKVGGYNENMGKYYAVEDDELAMRLISYGLNPISLDVQKYTALHIAHTDKDRVKNFESFEAIHKILTQNKDNISEDKLYDNIAKLCRTKNHSEHPIVTKMMDMFNDESNRNLDIEWYEKPIYKWNVTQINDQIYEAFKI